MHRADGEPFAGLKLMKAFALVVVYSIAHVNYDNKNDVNLGLVEKVKISEPCYVLYSFQNLQPLKKWYKWWLHMHLRLRLSNACKGMGNCNLSLERPT